MKPIETI